MNIQKLNLQIIEVREKYKNSYLTYDESIIWASKNLSEKLLKEIIEYSLNPPQFIYDMAYKSRFNNPLNQNLLLLEDV